MASTSDKNELTINGVRASTVALFEATLAGAIGLAVAILFGLSATFHLTQETNSILAGLTLGIGAGAAAIILIPLIYFGIGYLIGYIHGWVFNAVLGASRGVTVYTNKK